MSFSSWKKNRQASGARETVGAGQLSQAGTQGRLGTAGTDVLWLSYRSKRQDRPWGNMWGVRKEW